LGLKLGLPTGNPNFNPKNRPEVNKSGQNRKKIFSPKNSAQKIQQKRRADAKTAIVGVNQL
jgi:hypothetical protein